ncbi:MAG: FtsX-like permease family protein, partial [Pirellulaceae bacterium]|nr:FtsX-like permease family protein [Pirellulaceae bacterium]
NSVAQRMQAIPGVARAQSRIVHHVLLNMPQMHEPAACRIVSIGSEPNQELNAVYLRSGRYPTNDAALEVVASELFAEAHALRPGSSINVLMNGRQQSLTVVGTGMSPEAIYAVQPGQIAPDNRHFGILWMQRSHMESAFDMQGSFNSISFRTQWGSSTPATIGSIDRLAEFYGGRGAYDRTYQTSHARVSDEIHQMRTMAYITPAIFLAVVAFLFNIVLGRLVHQQREQIATLRAFGYRVREILQHYVCWILVWVALGTNLGIVGGYRLSWWMTDLYSRFFRFPVTLHEVGTVETLLALVVSLAAAAIGAAAALRKVILLQPAVAMRPESPPHQATLIIDRLGLTRFFSPLARLVVGRLQNNPVPSLLTVMGIALGMAVVVVGAFMEDTIDYVIDEQYQRSQRQDIMVTFNESRSSSILHDLETLPGVQRVEPFRSMSVRLRNGTRERRLGLLGLEQTPDLFRVLDSRQRPIELPVRSGLTITEKLAELLDVHVGQEVEVEFLEGARRKLVLPIAAVFPNYGEPAAYLNRHSLHQYLREGEQLSGAFLDIDYQYLPKFYQVLKKTPNVLSVMDNNIARENFRALVAESTGLMRWINSLFATVIALGILYNAALISLAERGRELATLRVRGCTHREVSFVVVGEQAVLVCLALPIGIPVGYCFAYLVTQALDTESHRFPLIVGWHTFSYAAVVIICAAMTSSLIMNKMLRGIELVSVLKVKE